MGFNLYGNKDSAPCYGCTDRSPGCHGSCEKYTAWKAEKDAKNAECMRIYEINYNLSAQKFDSWKRATNREFYRAKHR